MKNQCDEISDKVLSKSAKHEKADIQDELMTMVIGLFRDSMDYYKLDLVSKYQAVFETTSFLFEDFRNAYETLIKERFSEDLTDEQQQVESIVFCSWVSIEVMTELSNPDIRT